MVSQPWVGILACLPAALANVEKAIFLGPATVNVPLQPPTLGDLHIDVLTPANFSLRTYLEAQFPTNEKKSGTATWLLLDGLTKAQRYEVRVCWAATQPTDFILNTYELPTVWETPELISSLWGYSMSRQPQGAQDDERPKVHSRTHGQNGEKEASLLFLQIFAAANYYTTNATLMRNVPPVHVDIILDPFLFNVLPRSLAPTGGFIVAVAIVSYFVARLAVSRIQGIAKVETASQATKKRQ